MLPYLCALKLKWSKLVYDENIKHLSVNIYKFGLIFKLLAKCVYIAYWKHMQKCPLSVHLTVIWSDRTDSKMQHSDLQARSHFPGMLYGDTLTVYTVWRGMWARACVYTHASKVYPVHFIESLEKP